MVGFLCSLGFQYILGSFSFISVTSILNLFFRNAVFSDIFSIYWGDFIYRFSWFSIWWCYIINIIQTKFIDQNLKIVSLAENIAVQNQIAISKETATILLCGIFNFSVIILSFSFIVFLLFSVISLDDQLVKPLQRFVRSSVLWTVLGHGKGQTHQTQRMQILTLIILLFFTKNVKMKINNPKTFI